MSGARQLQRAAFGVLGSLQLPRLARLLVFLLFGKEVRQVHQRRFDLVLEKRGTYRDEGRGKVQVSAGEDESGRRR